MGNIIKYRVQYFNGTLNIATASGKCTLVNIECLEQIIILQFFL
jgi:hypothetical protein